MKRVYETTVINTDGRSGKVFSSNATFSYDLAAPGSKKPNTTNPEQLFAAGYSACFNSAVAGVMTKNKLTGASTIEVTVGLNRDETGAHWIDVKIEGHIDTLDLDQAQKILEQAHQNCPYSKATKGNIDVSVTAV